MPPYRNSQLLAALTLLTVLTWIGWSFRQADGVSTKPISLSTDDHEKSFTTATPPPVIVVPTATETAAATANTTAPSVVVPSDLLDSLCNYGVCDISSDASIQYSKIIIQSTETASHEAPLLQNLSLSLPELSAITSKNALLRSSRSAQKTVVETVPKPELVDASNLLFGVATNIDRLEQSLSQFSHWASNNGAQIIALIPNTSLSVDIDRTVEKSLNLNLNLTILTSSMDFNDRYFYLTSLMYNYTTPSTTWLSLIDDDTFFPSMNTLQSMLSKYPSPSTQPHYVGTLSEDLSQIFKWGYIAYGGGGIFISRALHNELAPHLTACAALPHTGDARIAQCIHSKTTTKLSPETQLYQLDLWGDASGFYEALRPQPISVHHWKSWHEFDMVNVSKVASVCGDACIFQKYRFANDWQLTNGFSLVRYSEGNERDHLDHRMEKTWRDSEGGTLDMFLHSIAPLKPKDEKKLQYLLEGCVSEDAGAVVRQFYVRRSTEGDANTPLVQIVEIEWRDGTVKAV